MKKKIIFDCDNTMGIKDCDIDDGLTLLYLMGCEDAELLGITTTFGNNQVDAVYLNTNRMLSELGRSDIPVFLGAAGPGCCEPEAGGAVSGASDAVSEASRFLVSMANEFPGELSVLATGSLTNLKGAYQEDPEFFDKVKEIVLMGGITEPLVFAKSIMPELNFSCDAEATFLTLTKGRNVSIMTGNNCLKLLFTREDFDAKLLGDGRVSSMIRSCLEPWFCYNDEQYGIKGFYNWDVLAGAYLMHPEFFEDNRINMKLSTEALETGNLTASDDAPNCILNLPTIDKSELLTENIYAAWDKADALVR